MPGALLLQKLFTSGSKDLDEKIKFMFYGVQGDTRQHIQCKHCKTLLGHECLHEEKLSLRHLNIQHCLIETSYVCLVCFTSCNSFNHLVAHLLMHSPVDLSRIGMNDSLLLKYVRQEYPIDPNATKLICSELVEEGDIKVVKLLAKHQTKNDGFTLELLKTLG